MPASRAFAVMVFNVLINAFFAEVVLARRVSGHREKFQTDRALALLHQLQNRIVDDGAVGLERPQVVHDRQMRSRRSPSGRFPKAA